MKLAIIGSYGHTGIVLKSKAIGGEVDLVAAARFGPDDAADYESCKPSGRLKVYDDYRRMLDEVRPDVVAVFMPLYRNAEASIAAAEHGCHVISEKPLATTLEDLARLRAAVGQAGVGIVALLAMRCEPAFQAARQAVADGRIGRPILAAAQKSYPFARRDDYYKKRDTYGGSIPWQAIHAIDLVSYCTGKDYAKVAAMHSNACHPSHPGMEDNGGLLFELVGGGHAVIYFDYLRPWPGDGKRPWGDDRLRVAGSEGILEAAGGYRPVQLMTGGSVEDLPVAAPRDIFAEFVDAISSRGECVITPGESFRATEVALKARQAADTGKMVGL
ncbi:MAG: Gfo/Idh/MocA family protein [Planctomycetota bacterium]|jgi:predicted dehydrogenase